MPCDIPGHNEHVWPVEGILDVQPCERYCAYCTEEGALKLWPSRSDLRRHVEQVHLRDFPGLTLPHKPKVARQARNAPMPQETVVDEHEQRAGEEANANEQHQQAPVAVHTAPDLTYMPATNSNVGGGISNYMFVPGMDEAITDDYFTAFQQPYYQSEASGPLEKLERTIHLATVLAVTSGVSDGDVIAAYQRGIEQVRNARR